MNKTILFLVLAGLYAAVAHAEHSAYLTSLTVTAQEKGFGKETLGLLLPKAASGKEQVATRLRRQLAQGVFGRTMTVKLEKPTRQGKKTVSYVTDKGSLEVYADGSKFRLRGNLDAVKPISAVSGQGQLPAEHLEKLGRDFITKQLTTYVKLAKGERLTFLGSKYLRQGGSDLKGKNGKEELFANIAIFGREVDGVAVVGNGSKIAVWFSPVGQAIGVDVDWPNYQRSSQKVPLLNRAALLKRVEASTTSLSESKESRITRFECGYVDLGATRRSSKTPIQPGCSVAYQGLDPESGATSWAKVEYVPAARKVLPDNRWPLASFIARSGEPVSGKQIPVPGAEPPQNAPQSSIEPVK